MSRWGNITSTCARWLTSYRSLESGLVVCAITEFYTFASLSIYFYCLSGSVDPSSRLSVCHYNYTARSPLTRWSSCISLLVRAITSLTGLFVLVGRMQRARRTRERIEIKHIDPLQFTADILYTKTEVDSLVVENKDLVEINKSWVVYSEALLVNQEAMLSEFAKWTSKVSDLAISLYNSTVAKGNEQARGEALPLEKEQQQALLGELAALASKLSALVTKQVDLEETKKKVREEKDKLRTKTVEEEHLRMEREKIETEKAELQEEREKIEIEKEKLQEERESLEEENEALKAKAKKLGIEEDKLRTTTPEEFKKLIDAQEKLCDDLTTLHDDTMTSNDDKSAEDVARLAKEFKIKTRETFLLMAANDKRIYEAWDLLESMDSITPEIRSQSDSGDYQLRTVAMFLADHMLEEGNQAEKVVQAGEVVQVAEEPEEKEDLHGEKGPQVLEVTEGLPEVEIPLVEEAHLAGEKPQEKAVLQVQDGLQ